MLPVVFTERIPGLLRLRRTITQYSRQASEERPDSAGSASGTTTPPPTYSLLGIEKQSKMERKDKIGVNWKYASQGSLDHPNGGPWR